MRVLAASGLQFQGLHPFTVLSGPRTYRQRPAVLGKALEKIAKGRAYKAEATCAPSVHEPLDEIRWCSK